MTILVKRMQNGGLHPIDGHTRLAACLEEYGSAMVRDLGTGEHLSVLQVDGEAQVQPLSYERIASILASQDEDCDFGHVAFYGSLEALADKARSSRSWSQGEVFVYAGSEDSFVVMKQIAPASCEMLTITQAGFFDVLTASAFELNALVAELQAAQSGSRAVAGNDPSP